MKRALEVASLFSRVLPLLGLKETGNKGAHVRRKGWALAWPESPKINLKPQRIDLMVAIVTLRTGPELGQGLFPELRLRQTRGNSPPLLVQLS